MVEYLENIKLIRDISLLVVQQSFTEYHRDTCLRDYSEEKIKIAFLCDTGHTIAELVLTKKHKIKFKGTNQIVKRKNHADHVLLVSTNEWGHCLNQL